MCRGVIYDDAVLHAGGMSLQVNMIEILVPAGEAAETVAEGSGGTEAEVALERRGIGVGDGDVSGLHRHEFLVRLEVVVFREYAGGDKFFLKYLHEVEEVLGVAVAYIIDGIRRHGQSVVACLPLGGFLHHADHTLHDVVDIGEVAAAVAVVEDPDSLPFEQLVSKAEVCHVRAAGGTVDGEEAETGRRYII